MASIENSGFESKNEVERIIEELKDSVVGVENYKKYIAKIENTERVIMAQLENFVGAYKELDFKYKEKLDSDIYKRAEQDGFIPKEIFDMQSEMNKILRDSYSWKSLAAEMNKVFFQRISIVLEDISALDIKKGALEELREMETKRNEATITQINSIVKMAEEIVNHKLTIIDDKIINTIKYIQQEMSSENKAMINAFIEVTKITSDEKKELIKKINVIEATGKVKLDEIKNEIITPIKKVEAIQNHDIFEDKESEEDDNPFIVDDDDELEDDVNDKVEE